MIFYIKINELTVYLYIILISIIYNRLTACIYMIYLINIGNDIVPLNNTFILI